MHPSAEALALAVKLSCHAHCNLMWNKREHRGTAGICDCCLDDAATIDCDLQLPQRNAALLLARALVEEYDNGTTNWDMTPLDALREALAAIKTI